MLFSGFQKMTLLDYPGRVACTLFTGGCNLRCPFCHNASLVLDPAGGECYSESEILSFLEKRKGLLDGVCVTGGEPLLHRDLPAFLGEIKKWGFLVKLDTNGTDPDRLRMVAEAGLVDYVAMDLKNCPEKIGETVGIPAFDISGMEESVKYLRTGVVAHEFRTTVVKEFHTVQNIRKIAEWIQGEERYFLQNFKDSGNLLSPGLHACDEAVLKQMKAAAEAFVPCVSIRGI